MLRTVRAREWVVVAGAGSGLGRDAALYFTEIGLHVFATVRTRESGEKLLAACTRPERLMFRVVDFHDTSQVAAALDAFEVELARFDRSNLVALVNNASTSHLAPFEHTSIEDFRRVFEVNLFATAAVIRSFLPLLKGGTYPGRVVLVGSAGGECAARFSAPYFSSKAAVEALADCLRAELYHYGVRVIVVQAGATRTQFFRSEARAGPRAAADFGIYARDMEFAKEYFDGMGEHLAFTYVHEVTLAVTQAVLGHYPSARIRVGREATVGLLLNVLVPDDVLSFFQASSSLQRFFDILLTVNEMRRKILDSTRQKFSKKKKKS